MSKYLCPLVRCKNPNCHFPGQPIRLPFPNPPEISEGQPYWPKATGHAWIVCRECAHGFVYTAPDVEWGAFQNRDQGPLQGFFRFELRCGHQGCEFPVIYYVSADATTDGRSQMRQIIESNSPPACENGHPLTYAATPLKGEWVTEIDFD